MRYKATIISFFVLFGMAGCVDILYDNGDEGDNGIETLDVEGDEIEDAIPSDVNMMIQADLIGAVNNDFTQTVGDTIIEHDDEYDDDFESLVDTLLDDMDSQIEEEFDEDADIDSLETDDFGNLVMYGNFDEDFNADDMENEYFAFLVELDVTKDEIDNLYQSVESDSVNIEKEMYENTIPKYSIEEDGETIVFAVLEDGMHVIGTEDAVEDTIETFAYESVEPYEDVPEVTEQTYMNLVVDDMETPVNETPLNLITDLEDSSEITSFDLTYETTNNGEQLNISSNIHVNLQHTANEIAMGINEELDLYEDNIEQIIEDEPNVDIDPDIVKDVIFDLINVTNEDSKVTIEYTVEDHEMEAFVEELLQESNNVTPQ